MSDIPRARDQLSQLTNDIMHRGLSGIEAVRRIHQILPLLYRETACRRAPAKPHKFTAEEKRLIKRTVHAEPNKTMHEIATKLGVRNGGRVSEIVRNKR